MKKKQQKTNWGEWIERLGYISIVRRRGEKNDIEK